MNPSANPNPDSPSDPKPQSSYQPGSMAPSGIYPDQGSQPPTQSTIGTSSPTAKRFYKRRRFLAAILLILVVGALAAGYFGYYEPNKPENMWRSALENTGKGYDKLSSYATSHKNAKGISLNGSFKINGPMGADGTFSGKTSYGNGQFKGSLSVSGLRLDVDLLTIKSAATAPDVYFRVNGLQGLGNLLGGGNQQFSTVLNGVNNHWYFIDHSLFNQYAKGADANLQFNSGDVDSILKAIGDASKQNVFTTDPNKAAFTVKRNIGKEKQDGRSVYHYKVGVNKPNLKNYVTTLCDNLKNSSLKKLFNGNSAELENSLGCNKADKSIDQINADDTADAWVDTHTKLIHKIRFSEKNKPNNYFDIGQDYQGGDIFPFRLAGQSREGKETSNGSLDLKLNTKANTLVINGLIDQKGSSNQSGSLKLTTGPNNTPVNVVKPPHARTLIELLNDLGLSGFLPPGSSR